MSRTIKEYPPTKMRVPFLADETEKVATRLKNCKSTGTDEINAENINYIHQKNYKKKLKESLNALQEQGKTIHWN